MIRFWPFFWASLLIISGLCTDSSLNSSPKKPSEEIKTVKCSCVNLNRKGSSPPFSTALFIARSFYPGRRIPGSSLTFSQLWMSPHMITRRCCSEIQSPAHAPYYYFLPEFITDLSEAAKKMMEFSRPLGLQDDLYSMADFALCLLKAFEKTPYYERWNMLSDSISFNHQADLSPGHTFLTAMLLTTVLYRNFSAYRCVLRTIPALGLSNGCYNGLMRNLVGILFSGKVTVSDLTRFLPNFDKVPFSEFARFVSGLELEEDFSHIREHLSYAFSLVKLSRYYIEICIASSIKLYDKSSVSHLFVHFLNSEKTTDKDIRSGIKELFQLSAETLKPLDLVAIAVTASFKRPECFKKLFEKCLAYGRLSDLLPHLDYSSSTVVNAVHTRFFDIEEAILKKAINTALVLDNQSWPHLMKFLFEKMSAEDYLVELIEAGKFAIVADRIGRAGVDVGEINYGSVMSKINLNPSRLSEFLASCLNSRKFRRLPDMYFARLYDQRSQEDLPLTFESFVNRLLASLLEKVTVEEDDENQDPLGRLCVAIISYSVPDIESFFYYLMDNKAYDALVKYSQFISVESDCTPVPVQTRPNRRSWVERRADVLQLVVDGEMGYCFVTLEE